MRLRLKYAGLLAAAAIAAAACSSGVATVPAAQPGAAKGGAVAPKPSAARYVLTQSQGATFDEASRGVAVPRPELAIVMGRRVKLEGGVITDSARSPAGLVGFRSLPDRLGGGYLVWSDLRTYHTKDFFGALTPVAEIGPTAGARPWFSSVLLRTDRGIFELSMAAGPKAATVKRWRPQPGVIDALSIDDKRGVTLDIMGRTRATTDGGATWSDVTAARGYFSNGARLGKKGEIELVSLSGSADLRLMPGASAVEPTPPPPQTYYGRRYNPYSPYQYNYMNPTPPPSSDQDGIEPISQTLAPDSLVWAAAVGLLLDGERALVGRDSGGLQVLSTKTGAELGSGALLGVSTEYSGCQPVRAGASILLACAHSAGAEILTLDGPITAPKLEATFPDTGPFLTDDRGHLAHLGRCGRTPPSADDFGARPVPRRSYDDEDSSYYPGGYGPYGGYGRYGGYGGYDPEYSGEPDEIPEKETPPADDKRICVRLDGGYWIEHRLTGDDAKDLYRWVLGDDGEVTVLLLKGVNPDEEDEDKDKDGPSLDDDDSPLRRPRGGSLTPPATRDLLATPQVPTASPAPPPSFSPVASPSGSPVASPSGSPVAPPRSMTSGSPKAGRPPSVPPKTLPAKADAKKPDAKKPEAKKVEPAKNGMRLVRLDPKDRALKKGKWTQIPTPQTQAPWRSIDRSFWLEPDGSIRGWMHLDAEGSGGGDYGSGMGDDAPELVSTDTSGRFAGVRISPQGKATVLPLPAHVQSVLFGGMFGLARADDDDSTVYYETTDGGATWTEVVGPPIGEMEDAYDESRFPACSAVGCALSSGLVRIGWGSPKPPPPKKEKEPYAGPGADAFPVPRLPKLECTFDGEPEAFPAPLPKPKSKTEPKATAAVPSPKTGGVSEDLLSQLPPDIQQMIRDNGGALPPGLAGMLPPGLLPPGLVPPSSTSSPVAPPPSGSASPSASSKPKAAKPAKPPPPPKAPPAPPAEVVSLRTKPQSALGQLKDKSWNADFVVPFDPTAPVKHLSTASNGLEKLTGYVVPVLGDRGVDLMLAWDKRRANLGAGAASLLPFDYNGRLDAAVILPGPAGGSATAKGAAGPSIVAVDDARHVLVLIQPDASRAFLRTARVPDPTRGKLALARRLDAPGAALVWYSPYSGDVLAGAVDFARAEIAPLVQLASTGSLVGGDLAACTAKPSGVTYELLIDLQLPVTVLAHGGKTLFSELNVPSTLRIRASAERLCITGVEVRGSGRPLDLTASFGAKSAAVARSRASAEDASKLSLDKLSCVLHEPESK